MEARLEARRERGFEARFAGRPLRSGMERDLGRDFLNRLGTATGASPQGAKGDPPGFADADCPGRPEGPTRIGVDCSRRASKEATC